MIGSEEKKEEEVEKEKKEEEEQEEEEEEQIIFSSGPIATHTHTHLKIVQCKKATELFISSNTLLQIVKSLKNVAYLVLNCQLPCMIVT